MSGARHWEQDKEATVYVGNIDERVTDSLVWELMLQAGRIVNVHLPKDRVTQSHQGYGFVEFISEEDAEYAARVMNQVRLYGKPIRVNKASADKQKSVEVGADLFIGNLDPLLDEKALYDTFSRFGPLVSPPKIARDADNGLSKGYGFVSYATFEAADDAIAGMNAQYLMNKDVSVQYAYKKDGKGERHGDPAERTLAAQAKAHGVLPDHAPMPPQLLGLHAPPPLGPAAMLDHAALPDGFPPQRAQQQHAYPPPPAHHHQQRPNAPLPPPPQGLPQRPPPSQAGYGGPPQDFHAPQQPYGAPPPGFAPPPHMQQQMPPGFMAPPPPPPPGFQQQQQQQGPPGGYRR